MSTIVDINLDLADELPRLGPRYAIETVREWVLDERCTVADAVVTLRHLSAIASRQSVQNAERWPCVAARKQDEAIAWDLAADKLEDATIEYADAAE